jgi:hypothetical protein
MTDKPTPLPYKEYTSFLLRLWQKRSEQENLWISSLQSTATGETFAFPNMEAFIQFLQTHFMTGQTSAHDCPNALPVATEQVVPQGDGE